MDIQIQEERLQVMLDDLGVPRVFRDETLSLGARCEFLRLAVARLQQSVDDAAKEATQFKSLWEEEVDAHQRTEAQRQELADTLRKLHTQVASAKTLLNLQVA